MPRRPQRDTLVLLAGILSAATLLYAAVGLVRAPHQAGEAALARAAGDVADAVVAEWGRLLRSEAPPFERAGPLHTWDDAASATAATAVPTAVEGASRELDAPPPTGSAVSALLAEAQRLDLSGDAAGALDAALCGLAAAPAFETAERNALDAELLERLGSGALPWPDGDGRLVLDARDPHAGSWESPRAQAVVERLADGAPENAEPDPDEGS